MNLFLGVTAFLVTDDHYRLTLKSRQPANDGMIIGKTPVAMKLFEIGKQMLDIIERIRTLGMPRDLRNLPRRKLGVYAVGK